MPLKQVVSTKTVFRNGLFADLELFWLEENLLYKAVSLPTDHRTVSGNLSVCCAKLLGAIGWYTYEKHLHSGYL